MILHALFSIIATLFSSSKAWQKSCEHGFYSFFATICLVFGLNPHILQVIGYVSRTDVVLSLSV